MQVPAKMHAAKVRVWTLLWLLTLPVCVWPQSNSGELRFKVTDRMGWR